MRRSIDLLTAAVLALAALVADVRVAASHDMHEHVAPADPAPQTARVRLQDVQLVDSDGAAVRFRSEAVGNRIVVVGFIYTSCTTICPLTSAMLADVQGRLADTLGDELGRDVRLITLTVDPVTDTPERLKEYAGNFGTPSGWIWLTGDKPKVDKVLAGLGAYAADFTRHSGAVLVGDARTGTWTRFSGIPDSAALVARVEQLLAARRTTVTERR